MGKAKATAYPPSSSSSSVEKKNVAVLVLGDIGRSPRMQYHSMSLAEQPNTHVSVIGYRESDPHPKLVGQPNVSIHPIKPFPSLPRYLFLLYAPIKVLWQIFYLFYILLFQISRPDFILVQNPPSIPTLLVVRVVSWIRGAKLVVDWHNLGYTLLQLTMHASESHPVIRFATWFERFFGSGASTHFTVTQKMKDMLVKEWKFKKESIIVLYDRPPSSLFRPFTSSDAKKKFLSTFVAETKTHSGKPISITPGSAIVVSSTSWTEDEDFGVLLDACVAYDQLASKNKKLPPITLFITGKGPLREYYEKKIAQLGMSQVTICTVWLAVQDYPLLLAASDLGVCLHVSSSKLDLPMKVVDMLGTELPVCAINNNYPALDELLPEGKFGRHFMDSKELSKQLEELLMNYPKSSQLSSLRKNIREAKRDGWDANWQANVFHVFSKK